MQDQFVQCSECGVNHNTSEMVQFGDQWVCSECKPRFDQRVREGASRSGPAEDELPMFVKVVLIVDLVMCSLRALLVALGIVGSFMLMTQGQSGTQLVMTVLEVASGLVIAAAGLSGNIMMLLRKRAGLFLGIIATLATSVSILIGVIQALTMYEQFVGGTEAQMVGFIIGFGLTALIRIGLLVLYIVALVGFTRFLDRQSDLGGRGY